MAISLRNVPAMAGDSERVGVALPVPVDKQREVIYLAGAGHTAVLGTAGSGKTLMAVLRAAYLSDPKRPDHGRTLLITFNKTLGTYIRFVAEDVLDRVTVENFHLFARGYLNSRGLMPKGALLVQHHERLVSAAVQALKLTYATDIFLNRPIDFFKEEIKWIGQHGIATLEAYTASSRAGRGDARMLRSQRALMWEVYLAYLRMRSDEGYLYDLDDIAGAVERALDADTSERLYKNVIIDEGQDLSPAMLRALAKAVPRGGSLTFFGDVAQQIYGHRMSWKSAGLKPAKLWMFEQNYRNTSAIAALAIAISAMPYYADAAADLVVPQQPAAQGPKPTLVSFTDPEAELDFIVRRAPIIAQGRSVAILTRTREQARRIQDRIANPVQQLSRKLTKWSGGAGLSIGTLHAGKGLEFDVVFLPFLSEGNLPNPVTIEAVGLEDATAGDGRLLYVGVTRARAELLLTYSGIRTSLLPPDPTLYTTVPR